MADIVRALRPGASAPAGALQRRPFLSANSFEYSGGPVQRMSDTGVVRRYIYLIISCVFGLGIALRRTRPHRRGTRNSDFKAHLEGPEAQHITDLEDPEDLQGDAHEEYLGIADTESVFGFAGHSRVYPTEFESNCEDFSRAEQYQ
eukprot:2670232-Pyramimonas_sp.AAC.1